MSNNNLYTKTPMMVEKEQGRPFMDIYNELASKGLSLTEIGAELKIRNLTTLSNHVMNKTRVLEPLDESKFVINGLIGKSYKTIEKIFREQLGIEYKDFLIQKYINEGMNLEEIRRITGINKDALSDSMVRYGIKKSKSTSRREALEKGNINMEEVNRKARKSRSRSISKSNKQDALRELLKHHIESRLSNSTYSHLEIITGYSEWSVLNNLEIDIPIIVCNGNQVTKIALEYNGDYWHNKERVERRDNEKQSLLTAKGWILIEIEETNKDSNNFGYLEEHAKSIVDSIFTHIE